VDGREDDEREYKEERADHIFTKTPGFNLNLRKTVTIAERTKANPVNIC
jgi:hypothetical protein